MGLILILDPSLAFPSLYHNYALVMTLKLTSGIGFDIDFEFEFEFVFELLRFVDDHQFESESSWF